MTQQPLPLLSLSILCSGNSTWLWLISIADHKVEFVAFVVLIKSLEAKICHISVILTALQGYLLRFLDLEI